MGGRLFGTDGIRAPFGRFPLDRPTVVALGFHLARHLAGLASGGQPRVLCGGDTRDSTPVLARWLAAGLRAGGAATRFAGTAPTPAVAFLVRDLDEDAGIAVSASHNPHPDNGIKLIDRQGFKWSAGEEQALEERLAAGGPVEATDAELPVEGQLVERYLERLRATLPEERPLAGLRLALDAANGAASPCAAGLVESLGAEVEALGDRPDGRNINDGCGSTHPEALAARVAAGGFDLGVAFDGDADRALFVDEGGTLRDGDAALFVWARALRRSGRLEPPRVVATTMSNLGLEEALRGVGIELVRCDVGDRVVVETMRREGILLGGEQSGHLVHLGLSTTGDGLLTALQIAALLRAAGQPFSRWVEPFRRFPQVLLNVPVAAKPDLASLPEVAEAARRVERQLGNSGRLVLRYSGTEPLARVMIEGPEEDRVRALAEELAAALRRAIGREDV